MTGYKSRGSWFNSTEFPQKWVWVSSSAASKEEGWKNSRRIQHWQALQLCEPVVQGHIPIWSGGLRSWTQSPPGRMNLYAIPLLWRAEHLSVRYLGDYFLISLRKYLGCSAQKNGLPGEAGTTLSNGLTSHWIRTLSHETRSPQTGFLLFLFFKQTRYNFPC